MRGGRLDESSLETGTAQGSTNRTEGREDGPEVCGRVDRHIQNTKPVHRRGHSQEKNNEKGSDGD